MSNNVELKESQETKTKSKKWKAQNAITQPEQVKWDNFSMTMQDNFCCHACEVLRVRDGHVSPSPFIIIIIFIFHFSIIIKPLFYFYCDASQSVALILSFQKHGLWLNQHHSLLLIAALSIKFTNQSCIYMHTQLVLFCIFVHCCPIYQLHTKKVNT